MKLNIRKGMDLLNRVSQRQDMAIAVALESLDSPSEPIVSTCSTDIASGFDERAKRCFFEAAKTLDQFDSRIAEKMRQSKGMESPSSQVEQSESLVIDGESTRIE